MSHKLSWVWGNSPNYKHKSVGGSGTVGQQKVVHRRAVVRTFQFFLKVDNSSSIEEVIHLSALRPGICGSEHFHFYKGRTETKELTGMLPWILNQCGAACLPSLGRIYGWKSITHYQRGWWWSSRSSGEFWWSFQEEGKLNWVTWRK